MNARIIVLYYSMFGNTYHLARSACRGVREAGGEALLRTVPELIPEDVVRGDARIKSAKELQKEVKIVEVDELRQVDGVMLGSPTRFGNMCAQLRNFWDQTGGLWGEGILVDKPAGVFCCTASMHGGQETTLVSMMLTLLHHGMLILGVPYTVEEVASTVSGGTPYGASAVVGATGERRPDRTERAICRKLAARVTALAMHLGENPSSG